MFCADPFLGKMNLIAGFVQCKKGQFEDHTYRRRNQECFRPSFGAVVLQYPYAFKAESIKFVSSNSGASVIHSGLLYIAPRCRSRFVANLRAKS